MGAHRVGAHQLCAMLLPGLLGYALAQVAPAANRPSLTPPLDGSTPPQTKEQPALQGIPIGKGAGVHSPNSAFSPLPKRQDVVPWSVLTALTTKTEKNKIRPVFTPEQLGLHQKTQKIQGFMMPLEPGRSLRHFLLTSVPLTCSFCLPGGPESMVEVRAAQPVLYTLEPVVVSGTLQVLHDDPYGLYYRMSNAAPAK